MEEPFIPADDHRIRSSGHQVIRSSPHGPAVSVIIPNWNGRRFLAACFQSLRAQRFHDFEVVLVDNGSRDDSLALTAAEFPEVRVIALPENVGFAPAVNRGIEASHGRYVALLNNDTEADPDWLGELVQALERNPGAASAAAKMREHDAGRRDRLYGLGQALTPDGAPHRVGGGELDCGQWDDAREVFGACGGAALYRRSTLEEIGLLDELFFAYLEDDDWAFRARLAGYHCVAVPTAVVYHVGSGTSGAGSPLVFRLGTRNRVRLLLKNYPASWLLRYLPAILVTHARLLVASAMVGRLGPVLRGYGEALCQLPDTLRERRRVQSLRRASDAALRAALSPSHAFVRPLPVVVREKLRRLRSSSAASGG
jgi:GT2 family glycosyltransferase